MANEGVSFVTLEPEPGPVVPRATPEECRLAWASPYVGFNNEEAFGRDEEYHRALVVVACPSCHRRTAPFVRRDLPRYIDGGWEWVGISYRQPYSNFLCSCSHCHRPYRLHAYTPQ